MRVAGLPSFTESSSDGGTSEFAPIILLCFSFLVSFLLDFLGSLNNPYSAHLPVISPSFFLKFLIAFVHNLTILSKA